MADRVDPEMLISLVESRPGLWDKSLDLHKDFLKRSVAWRDICRVLNSKFDRLPRKEKHDYAKMIIKKWTNIRDAWRKSVAEVRRNCKPYIYHYRLRFLQKNLHYSVKKIKESAEEADRRDETLEEESDDSSSSGGRGSSSRGTADRPDTDRRTRVAADRGSAGDHNRHVLFTRGLLGTLNGLNDDETLEFQAGVIRVLQEIRKRRRPVDKYQIEYTNPNSSTFGVNVKIDQL